MLDNDDLGERCEKDGWWHLLASAGCSCDWDYKVRPCVKCDKPIDIETRKAVEGEKWQKYAQSSN